MMETFIKNASLKRQGRSQSETAAGIRKQTHEFLLSIKSIHTSCGDIDVCDGKLTSRTINLKIIMDS